MYLSSCSYHSSQPFSICARFALKRRWQNDHRCGCTNEDCRGYTRGEGHPPPDVETATPGPGGGLSGWYLDLTLGAHPDLVHCIDGANHTCRGTILSKRHFALYPFVP